MSHTPAPWVAELDSLEGDWIVDSEPLRVGYGKVVVANVPNTDCDDDEGKEAQANARLIAAAPALLHALEAAVASIAALRSYIERNADGLNDEAHLHLGNSEVRIRDGLAALAKARGAS
jgi:hypothetical protein